jgi:hypothetical protein
MVVGYEIYMGGVIGCFFLEFWDFGGWFGGCVDEVLLVWWCFETVVFG